MTSSTITGERRWASARRVGMTVLGKVAVPKPINLPSQRLENHGLNPNVEIVPKGTLSWGSKSSSGCSNAWGTSTLSPSTDGGSSSPSHLVGRPLSGGGSRPSTAGSERIHDSNVNPWSSNSRPSSASGASNNASLTSLRPCSAEARPGSSHLSRFAEISAENSGAWVSTIPSECSGNINSGKDGFSLSSGDFPTLGSEKDESRKITERQDHASHRRPGSSCGVTTMTGSMGTAYGDVISRNVDFGGNSWKRDGPFVEDGSQPSMDRCYGEPYPCQNPIMGPHYESWRCAQPVNPPGGVWYRGPPGPPPYGAPGGFPMEAFPYYRHQLPAPGLANSHQVPPPATGPQGHHSKNGDMYRPHMSESYMRPGMSMRPGFYPAPLPYEGYYGPPPRFCNPCERDMPFMGMPTGPAVYSRPVNPNILDPNNAHPRHGEGRVPNQLEPCHPHDPQGNYMVLRKQNDTWNQNNDQNRGHKVTTSAFYHEKGILSKASMRENAWGDDDDKDLDTHDKSATVEEVHSHSFQNKSGSSSLANLKFPGSSNNVNDAARSLVENADSPMDHSLIQKIGVLNAKTCSDVRQDDCHREGQHDFERLANVKANRSANDVNSDVVLEKYYPSVDPASFSNDIHIVSDNKGHEITVPTATAASRKPTPEAQSRCNRHGKGTFIGQEVDGWRKGSESHTVVSATGSGSSTNDQVECHVVCPVEMPKPTVEKEGNEESVMSPFVPCDVQRAKMKEIAKQRAIQLQKEEEERIREQRAKALAKLDELNRRSTNQCTENPGHMVESVMPYNAAPYGEDPRNQAEGRFDAIHCTKSSSASANSVTLTNERGAGNTLGSVSFMHVGEEAKRTADDDSVSLQNQFPIADVNFDDAACRRAASQVREVSKQKRLGPKHREHIPLVQNSSQDFVPAGKKDAVKDLKDFSPTEEVPCDEVASGGWRELGESTQVAIHQKKKSGKTKHKVEESSAAASSSGIAVKKSDNAEAILESAKLNGSNLNINSTSIQFSVDARDANRSSENYCLLAGEDGHGGGSNSLKPQQSRKPRNSQGNKSSEKSHSNDAVVWAPVRSHNKIEATDLTSLKAAEASGAKENPLNVTKTKRAEIERYVPKPIANELMHQGSVQQSSAPSVDQAASDRTTGRVMSAQDSDYFAKMGSVVESKLVDGKHRQRALCRHRVSAELIPVEASLDGSLSVASTIKNIETANGSEPSGKPDESLMRRSPSRSEESFTKEPLVNVSDGWNGVNSDSSPSVAFPDVTGKGRKTAFKGHRGEGSNQNIDHKDRNTGLTNLQHPHIQGSQTQRTMPLKENRAVGDSVTSHWQPKSRGYVANQQGNRYHGSQKYNAEESKATNGDSHPMSQHNRVVARDRTGCEDKDVSGVPSFRHKENKRDKVASPVSGRPGSADQKYVGDVEPGPFRAAEGHSEQRPSSGHHRNANHGRRFSKKHEPQGDWSSTAPENKQHYSSVNRERQRPNSLYEYQPVGPCNNSNSSRSDDSVTPIEVQSGGPKFRERGHSHSRRGKGNFYGRQRGNSTEASYE